MAVATEQRPFLPAVACLPRPAGWEPLRLKAESALADLDWPTARQEAWKYTDLAALKAEVFAPAAPAGVDIGPLILPEARGSRLVFVNGHYDPRLSTTANLPPGVRLLNLASASELAHELGSIVNEGGRPLAMLALRPPSCSPTPCPSRARAWCPPVRTLSRSSTPPGSGTAPW